MVLKNSLNSFKFFIFLSLTLSPAISCMETDYPQTLTVSQKTYDKLVEVQKLVERRDQIDNSFKPLMKYLGCVGLGFSLYSGFKLCFSKYGGALVLPEDIAQDRKFTVYCLKSLLNGFKLCSSLLLEQNSINDQLPLERAELRRLLDQDRQL